MLSTAVAHTPSARRGVEYTRVCGTPIWIQLRSRARHARRAHRAAGRACSVRKAHLPRAPCDRYRGGANASAWRSGARGGGRERARTPSDQLASRVGLRTVRVVGLRPRDGRRARRARPHAEGSVAPHRADTRLALAAAGAWCERGVCSLAREPIPRSRRACVGCPRARTARMSLLGCRW